MNKFMYKLLGVLFGIMSFGAISETHRIMTSNAEDIVPKRSGLTSMAFVMTAIFIALTIFFWRKGRVK